MTTKVEKLELKHDNPPVMNNLELVNQWLYDTGMDADKIVGISETNDGVIIWYVRRDQYIPWFRR